MMNDVAYPKLWRISEYRIDIKEIIDTVDRKQGIPTASFLGKRRAGDVPRLSAVYIL
jgi:hypothetical protein